MFLRISLFGGVQIERDGEPDQSQISNTARMLLAYLVLYRDRAHSRDMLASMLWGDYSQARARNCLNTTLWRLRRILEPHGIPAGTYLLTVPAGELAFNLESQFWLDVAEFESRVAKITALPVEKVSLQDVYLLEDTVHLYKGDLLEGHYCEWALRERERLRLIYLDAMFYLMRFYCLQNNASKAIGYGQKIIAFDPLREDVHRQMIRLYLQNGQRSLAVRQYRLCEAVLRDELAIQPMRETQLLFEQVLSAEPVLPASSSNDPSEVDAAVRRLQSAIVEINHAQRELQKALAFFEEQKSLPSL